LGVSQPTRRLSRLPAGASICVFTHEHGGGVLEGPSFISGVKPLWRLRPVAGSVASGRERKKPARSTATAEAWGIGRSRVTSAAPSPRLVRLGQGLPPGRGDRVDRDDLGPAIPPVFCPAASPARGGGGTGRRRSWPASRGLSLPIRDVSQARSTFGLFGRSGERVEALPGPRRARRGS